MHFTVALNGCSHYLCVCVRVCVCVCVNTCVRECARMCPVYVRLCAFLGLCACSCVRLRVVVRIR